LLVQEQAVTVFAVGNLAVLRLPVGGAPHAVYSPQRLVDRHVAEGTMSIEQAHASTLRDVIVSRFGGEIDPLPALGVALDPGDRIVVANYRIIDRLETLTRSTTAESIRSEVKAVGGGSRPAVIVAW
jgi:hypothetical protein